MRSMWMRMRSEEAIDVALSSRSCWSLDWSGVNPRMGACAKQQARLSRTSRVLNIAQHAVYHEERYGPCVPKSERIEMILAFKTGRSTDTMRQIRAMLTPR